MRPAPEPPKVYAIADAGALAPRRLAEGAEEMAAAGVRWIQLRAKRMSDADWFEQAEECRRRLEGSGALLWIDDRADLAALVGARGVHVGQRDLPPAAVRRVAGEGVWIGRSTHDLEQLAAADADAEVDVVAFGPIFATRGKERPDPTVGLEALAEARRRTAKPLVAIGGIGPETLARVLAAGADSAAMIGAVCRGRIGLNCRRLLDLAEERRGDE